MERPFSQACENNQGPILEIIRPIFAGVDRVLEVGTGTGQHAVYFARQLPQLFWQTSDRREYHEGIHRWLDWAALPNIGRPLELDVDQPWSLPPLPAVFSSNTVHIMAWSSVENLFRQLAALLVPDGHFCLYGPFNYHGAYSSDSNARFDAWLKSQNPHSAIRDFEKIDALAAQAGLQLRSDTAMPANNRLLHWQMAS
jgi:cyclopropane fatty-acyl-phospholipid synthase-like methyltransferase